MKTYYNVYATMNVWAVIDELQAIGLTVTAMTATSITVMTNNGMSLEQVDILMNNRGFI